MPSYRLYNQRDSFHQISEERQVTPEDYWPPLINLNIQKLNEHTYHTESHAYYVFGNSFSTSNTINEIQKTLQKKLYMKWYG